MFEGIFQKKSINIEKALLFGFKKENGAYLYETDILEGLFCLHITISSADRVKTNFLIMLSGGVRIMQNGMEQFLRYS